MTEKTTSILSMGNTQIIEMVKNDLNQSKNISLDVLMSSIDKANLTDLDRKTIASMYEITIKEVEAKIKQLEQYHAIHSNIGQYPKDEYEFVDLQLERWNTKMTFHGTFTIKTPYDLNDGTKPIEEYQLADLDNESQTRIRLADPKTFEMVTMLARLRYASRKLKLNYKDHAIEHALNFWVTRTRNDLIAKSISGLVYAGDDGAKRTESLWDQYVEAITDVNLAETKVVLKHFIWQVKRKMFRLPVRYHMMLIFKGQQEGGKSTMIRDHLCNPVKDFFASTNFKAITEDKSHNIWDNHVLFFDEMGHSTTSNLEDIKRRITEDNFSSRIMRTNSDTIVHNRATFIGASNKDLSRLIFDDTGMRRFYQVLCRAKLDWTALETIDWIRLWRSVDETAETPLLADADLLTNIKQLQASKRQVSMIEKWLRERKHTQFIEESVMAQAFYEEFVEFEKVNAGGRSDMNNTKFGRDVKDIALLIPGLYLRALRTNKGNVYKITYTESTDLVEENE
jgi:hypothetical protein